MDPDFGHWFAGFFDGEGSLCIDPSGNRRGVRCSAKISLRADDASVLEQIQDSTGLGWIYFDKKGRAPDSGSQPCVAWAVGKKAECLALVEIFEEFPLRAKKRRDLIVWSLAVREWCASTGRWRDWSRMEDLSRQIRAVRQFQSEHEIVVPEAGLRLFGDANGDS